MSLIVRLADTSDCKDVYKITKAAFKEYSKRACPEAANAALSETEEDVLRDIENKYVFLAVLDGKPVGRGEVRSRRRGDISYWCRRSARNSV